LPPYITKHEVKKQYKKLAKKYHPDIYKDAEKMRQINKAYELILQYIENYRFSFDDKEIEKQIPGFNFKDKFKP
jgi:DnaJ-class molecular chaperone